MTTIEYEWSEEHGGEIETIESWDRRMEDRYRPSPETPWRVSWGLGVFEDFATEEEAQRFYKRLRRSETGDWKNLVNEPFNAVEAWARNR
jgi:hypothetical protein